MSFQQYFVKPWTIHRPYLSSTLTADFVDVVEFNTAAEFVNVVDSNIVHCV
jgi:hypothetical protein